MKPPDTYIRASMCRDKWLYGYMYDQRGLSIYVCACPSMYVMAYMFGPVRICAHMGVYKCVCVVL